MTAVIKKAAAVLISIVIMLNAFIFVWATEPSETEPPADTEETGETGETVETQPAETGVSMEGVSEVEFAYDFEVVYENDEAILLLDRKWAALRVVSKATGLYYDTKEMNGQRGNEVIKNNQKSDFTLTYYTDMDYGYTKTLDSYSMSVVLKQMEYVPIDGGVRINYTIGEKDKVTLSMFPMYISKERLQELVLDYLDDNQLKDFFTIMQGGKERGYYTEASDRYVRNWDTYKKSDGLPTPVAQPILNRMYNYFYVLGTYTEDDLTFDNELWGEEPADSKVTFDVALEYRLEGKDLVVTLKAGEIKINAQKPDKYRVSEITVNPYLLSGSIYDDGYLLLPDGSGALVTFGTHNATAPVFDMPVYGADILNRPWFYKEAYLQTTLPVMGVKKDNVAILAVIENGAAAATISANGVGKVDEFAKTSARFEITHMELLPLLGTKGGATRPKYSNKSYDRDIVIRYLFLEGGDANYTAMAKAYQGYLVNRGELTRYDAPADAPLFVEAIATVPVSRRFLGLVPYTAYEKMTTLGQAKDILESLRANGVGNVIMEYVAWTKGSFNAVPLKNLSIAPGIGGSKGLKSLADWAGDNGAAFLPTVSLLRVTGSSGLSVNKDIAKFLNNSRAFYPEYNMVTRMVSYNDMLISPNYLSKYTGTVAKNLINLGQGGVAVRDAGTLIYGDYNTYNQLLRFEAIDAYVESLGLLDEKLDVLFHNANAYVFKYASYITDLPTYDSGRVLTDQPVPFVQMVLENCVPYSMEAYNSKSITDFSLYLLKAVETKSAFKFYFTWADEAGFNMAYTWSRQYGYFHTQYSRWEAVIGGYYAAYNEFYRLVRDAEITSHWASADRSLVRVGYSNGVTVRINYGDEEATLDGVAIPPRSYDASSK